MATANPTTQLREKRPEKAKSRESVCAPSFLWKRDKKVPLAAMPKREMLTTMKARWYHPETENNLVSDTSRIRVAIETRSIPEYLHRLDALMLVVSMRPSNGVFDAIYLPC